MKKKRDRVTKILAIALLVSMCLPILAVNIHHDCRYDECFRIFHNDKIGMCVEKVIDNTYSVIAIVWVFSVFGGLMILQKYKNALSPFVVMGLLIAFAVSGAFIDPAKWIFVIALLPSLAIAIIAVVVDNKRQIN